MSATLLWCFLGLGALAYFGARRGKWSYEVANLCWWATVWIATEDALIRWMWLAFVALNIMARSDFPRWQQFVSKYWFRAIGRVMRCIFFLPGDGWHRLRQFAHLLQEQGLHYDCEVDSLGIDGIRKQYGSLPLQRLLPAVFAAVLSIAMSGVIAWNVGETTAGPKGLLLFTAVVLVAVAAIDSILENWKNFKALRMGMHHLEGFTRAEQSSLLYYTELMYFHRVRLLPLHLAVLILAGGAAEQAAWVAMSGVLLFSGFEQPMKTEYFKVHAQRLWKRDLRFMRVSRTEMVLGTKLEVWGAVALAWFLAQPALFLFPWAKDWWHRMRTAILRMAVGEGPQQDQPQVVCWALGLNGFDWNWLDEKDLASKVDKVRWAWLYHNYYLDRSGNVTALKTLHASDGAIIAGRFAEDGCGGWYQAVVDFVQVPFRHLGVLEIDEAQPLWDGTEYVEGSMEYYCSIIDEPIFKQEDTALGEMVELEPLNLNLRLKGWLTELGFVGLESMYEGGVMELNILHRRVHEFSQPASRFLELLNIWELVARWALVVKQDEAIEGERERLSIPFGGVFDLVQKEPLMREKLNLPEGLIEEIRTYWKQVFNWSASMSSKPTVAEAFTWVIYIRNKTRGHGSTSRIHFKLYAAVEALTLLLFEQVRRHMNLELLVLDENAPLGVGTLRRGMRLEFLEEDFVQAAHLPPNEGGVFFRPAGSSAPWRASNLLKSINGHVFILNDMKKGHREWVCFSTGELIRPEVIFDR